MSTKGTTIIFIFNKNEILDKKIKVIKTNRGGKITLHNPNQKIVYFVINLNKRKKDVRKFINSIENSIIVFLKIYGIKAKKDKKMISFNDKFFDKRNYIVGSKEFKKFFGKNYKFSSFNKEIEYLKKNIIKYKLNFNTNTIRMKFYKKLFS